MGFDGKMMRKSFLPKLFLFAILAALTAAALAPSLALAAGGDPLWSKKEDVSGSISEIANAVAVDSTGVYIVGWDNALGAGNAQGRIEKRNLSTGNLISTFGTGGADGDGVITSSLTTNNDTFYDIAISSTAMYLVGSSNNYDLRIEKRDLSSGNLISTFGTGGADGDGVITSNLFSAQSWDTNIAINSAGIYIAGTSSSSQWRIEKRDLTTGNLISTFGTGGTDGDGVITSDPSGGGESPMDIILDTNAIYIVGFDRTPGNYQWRIEKRDLVTGNLISTFGTGGTDGDGVITFNPGTTNDFYPDRIYGIAVDSTAIYVVGGDTSVSGASNSQWRIEKRDLATGNLISTFGTGGTDGDGVITIDLSGGEDSPYSAVVDSTGVYIVGKDHYLGGGNSQWYMEKRSLTDGSIIWQKTVYTAGYTDYPVDIAIDSGGIYVVGHQDKQWLMEKRELGGGASPPPTVNLSAFPTTINSGESTTLSWTTTDATSCDDVPLPEWLAGPVGTAGSEVEWPTATTTYTISCTGPGGTTQQSTTVTVTAPCVPGWGTTTVDSAGSVGYNPSLAIGTDGFPAIAYSGSADLKVVKCSDAGCSSGNTFTVVDSIGSIWTPSLAIGTDGFPVIAYDIQNLPYNLKVAKCGNAGCSSGNTLTIVDSVAGNGLNPSIAIGTDGFPVIAYSTATWGVKLAKCGNTSCSSGNTIVTVDSVGWKPSLAIGTDGFPVIVYSDNTASSIKVAKCGNAGCNSGNTLTTVDSVGINDYTPSLAIGTDGFPVIAYRTATFDLKVAKCGNTSCSSGNTFTIVDSIGNVGAYSSLTIGTNGFPAIAYFDITNYNIKLAKCGNAGCNSGNTLTAVDSYGIGFGANSSIGIDIGTDGFPVVAYLDNANYDLKVAKESGCGGTPAPTVNLSANPSTINGGEYSDLTWSSTNAVSCAAVYPAGWTSQTGTSGTERLYPASTTIYTILCTGAGGTTYQATTVTVNAPPAGNDCGLRMFDGTETIILDCETPASTTSLRIYNNGTISGIKLVDPSDPNASRIRIAVPDGGGGTVIKALRKQ